MSLDSSRWSEEEFSPSAAAFTWMKKKERKERKNSICSSQKVKTEKVVFLVFGGKKVFLCWYSGHVPCCDLALGSETRREKRRSVAPQILPRCCCSSLFVPGLLLFNHCSVLYSAYNKKCLEELTLVFYIKPMWNNLTKPNLISPNLNNLSLT